MGFHLALLHSWYVNLMRRKKYRGSSTPTITYESTVQRNHLLFGNKGKRKSQAMIVYRVLATSTQWFLKGIGEASLASDQIVKLCVGAPAYGIIVKVPVEFDAHSCILRQRCGTVRLCLLQETIRLSS